MKQNLLFKVIIAAFLFAACSSSKENTGVWLNKEKIQPGKKYSKIFIVVVTADVSVRTQLENDLAVAISSKGYQAVKSIDLIPHSLSDPKPPSKDSIVAKVKSTGCDAVFVASLMNKDEAMRYTPSKSTYSVMPYYSLVGNYYGYYSSVYTTSYEPGYYTNDKEYFVLSNFYDAASEEIMWSVQSEVFNPTSIATFSKSYMTTLVKQLENSKLLKK
ncbi:MAG TPA: hypothetical protein VFZ47_12850 [Chitinophagaceae bacterium]